MRSNLRVNDVIARYGDDEFLIFLDNIDEFNAINTIDRLFSKINKKNIEIEDVSTSVKISVGAAIAKKLANPDTSKLLEVASEALYDAKCSGGGCVQLKDVVNVCAM